MLITAMICCGCGRDRPKAAAQSNAPGETTINAARQQPKGATRPAEPNSAVAAKPQRADSAAIPITIADPWKLSPAKGVVAAREAPTAKGQPPLVATDDDSHPERLVKALKAATKEIPASWLKRTAKLRDRRTVSVVDQQGKAVPMAVVNVREGQRLVWRGRTYSDGKLRIYPGLAPGLTDGGVKLLVNTEEFGSRAAAISDGPATTLKLNTDLPTLTRRLDLCLLLDLRQSARPALVDFIKGLPAALARLKVKNPGLVLRMSAVLMTGGQNDKAFGLMSFTESMPVFLQALAVIKRAPYTTGGGRVESALKAALDRLSWGRMTSKVIVSFTDGALLDNEAPKHPWTTAAIRLGAMGFRVLAFAGSNTSRRDALLLRQLTHFTRGRLLAVAGDGNGAMRTTEALLTEELNRWGPTAAAKPSAN